MQRERDLDKATGASGKTARDDRQLGVAALGKLLRLTDVFGEHQSPGEPVVDSRSLQRRHRRLTIGRVLGIGDGDSDVR